MGILGKIEDREAIRELYAQYAHTLDNGRYEDWLGCFTPEGSFESPRFGRYAGGDGLKKFVAVYKDSLGGAKPMHFMSNVTFAIEGDTAKGGCYLAYFHCKDGKAELSAVAHYIDTLRKVGGEWRFESRKVAIDGAR